MNNYNLGESANTYSNSNNLRASGLESAASEPVIDAEKNIENLAQQAVEELATEGIIQDKENEDETEEQKEEDS